MEFITRFWNIKKVQEDVEASTPKKRKAQQKALTQSIKEGAAANFSLGVSETYITPLALALKANPLHIGVISAITGLGAPLAELWGSKLMLSRTRKKIVLQFVAIQTLAWLLIAGLTLLYFQEELANYLIYGLIALVALVSIAHGLALPAWFSWVGDLVPDKDRGKFFSIRGRVTSTVGLIAVLIGAYIIDYFETQGLAMIGFAIIFALASFFRLISLLIFRKQYAPKFKQKRRALISFKSFLTTKTPFRRMTIFQGWFYFALMLASPFFAVYMLEVLQFNKITFAVVTMSATVFNILFAPTIGAFADRFGSRRLLAIGTFLFAINPISWLFITNPLILITIPQLIAGLANAAFNIGTTNYTLGAADKQHRAQYLAYHSLILGIGTALGALVGGYILELDLNFTSNAFLAIFAISAAARFLVGIIFIPRLEEVEQKEQLPPLQLTLLRPVRALHAELAWIRNALHPEPTTKKQKHL